MDSHFRGNDGAGDLMDSHSRGNDGVGWNDQVCA